MHTGNGNSAKHISQRLRRSRRVFLWISLAVFLPLLIMVGLQYFWLVNLERTSKIARKAQLENYIANIQREAQYLFWYPAENLVNNVTAAMFAWPPEKLETFYKKRSVVYKGDRDPDAKKWKPVKGARYIFHNAYKSDDRELYVFDVERQSYIGLDDLPPEVRDLLAGTALVNRILAEKKMPVGNPLPREDFTTEGYPMMYNPIPNDDGHLAGIMGLVFNLDFMRHEALPAVVRKGLPKSERAFVSVRLLDREGDVRFEYGRPYCASRQPDVSGKVPSLLGGGTITMSGDPAYTEWAGNNFTFNVLLSLFLALALALGLIFALRTASREIQLSEMKNDFVSNVSHELRTPLASIRVFGEMLHLGRVKDWDKVRDYGELIDTESRRLTQLINNILDFSKIERGHKRYRMETGDIRDVIARVLKVFEVRLQETDLRIHYREPDAPFPLFRFDPDAIGQAFFNLVDNGVKYGREGERLDVSLQRDNEYLVISVRDYGIGIPHDDLDKVFERFHRVSTGSVHDVKGSGLGLSITAHVARAHGGEVRVESEVGKGSTFSLRLPLSKEVGEGEIVAQPT